MSTNETIADLVEGGKFVPTSDISLINEADAVIICVPTPLTRNREPDLSYVIATTEAIAPHMRPGQLISLESTTYPGTTREVMRPILERAGLRSGIDFFLVYSPEREDPGNRNIRRRRSPRSSAATESWRSNWGASFIRVSFQRRFPSRLSILPRQ